MNPGRSPALSVLVLTEDGSSYAPDTLTALARKMFCQVEPACQTQRIEFEPQDERERRSMAGNLWKSTNSRDEPKRRDLVRAIVTKLLEPGVPGFVLFHIDGDRPWAAAATSENVAKFEELIRAPVRRALAGRSPDPLPKLLPVVPFYSIEAWLYQNTTKVRSEMKGQHGCKQGDRKKLATWEADPALLDEVEAPKDHFCLGGTHNLALTAAFPADKVLGAGKSFAAAVQSMKACQPLVKALAATTV
ncbi:MAG: hypothetical protein ABIO70_19820 [Pseudomonadota bacterium]